MATLSFKDFSKGGAVSTIGNESQVQQKEAEQGPSLMSQLGQRAKTIVNEVTGQPASSILAGADKTSGADIGLSGVGALNRTAQAPFRVTGAIGGAVGDVIGAGIKATGADKPIGEFLKPVAETDIAQNAIKAFQSLPPEYQEYLKIGLDEANLVGLGVGKKAITSGVESTVGAISKAKVPEVVGNVVSKVTPTSEGIMQRVARIPKGEQAKFEALTGESVGTYLDKRGIYGTPDKIVEQLYNRFNQSKQTADDALATIQGTYRATPVRTALTELEGKVQRTSSPGAPDPDLARITELANKEKTTGLNMSEINEVKRFYERRVRLDYVKTNLPEDVARATNVDSALREWQFAEAKKVGLKNLPEINKETQATKNLMNALGKENAGVQGNNALGLTDAILLAGGSPESIASLLVKKTFSDPGVQSFAARKLSKNKVKQGVPKADFAEKLGLPAPKAGSPNVTNNVPIKLKAVSESTLDAELTKRFGKNYTQAQVQQFMLESGIGKKEFNTKPVNPLQAKGKTQSQADENLKTMNSKKGTPQSQEKLLPVSSPKSTTVKKKVNSTPVDNLEQEAKKYKSAEEFVKAQGKPIYRGIESNSKRQAGMTEGYSGESYTLSPAVAKTYGENVLKKYIPQNSILKSSDVSPELLTSLRKEVRKIVAADDANPLPMENVISKVMKVVEEQGKSAADLPSFFRGMSPEMEIRVLNPKVLKTKSQLTDIWKKANKK